MKRSVGACVLLVLLAGCAAPPVAPGGVPGAPTTGVRSLAPVAVSADPAACTAPQPARADPFPYNRDAAGRDATLKADVQVFCAEADESTFDGRLECLWD
ncbi:hypothetical protein ABT369_57285 [Dactylosporangium sp. NPDC000244]|uniref:hypothetical protein n=1 Tax=Dactylosporangium sp. NPDC000244 TaxID=3154365 RepID=UPI00331F1CB8